MSALRATAVGFVYGFVVAGLSFIIASGGHGWCSGLISSVGVILVPLAAVAWVRRRRVLAVAAIVFGCLADVALLMATIREGFDYVERIFATMPVLVLVWAVLWLLWQIALTTGLLRGRPVLFTFEDRRD